MRLTTKGRFAVTAMLDLAMREANGPVTLAGISERQSISFPIWNSCSANCAVPNW
jgi:Rrf2 family iron-sulfur cluster assembly transcriptional regulator